MLKVTRICDTCQKEEVLDIFALLNSRRDYMWVVPENVAVVPISFGCEECQIKKRKTADPITI
ncbi:MAG: hypothetical protein Q8P69_00785 [bacterium]|nr:hypothetical protein [bacterium]